MTSLSIAVLGTRGYPSTYGGFETLVRRLAPYLADRGHEVTVYGRKGYVNGQGDPRVRSVQTATLDARSLSTATNAFSASVAVRRGEFDVVLALNLATVPALLTILRDQPVVLNLDGLEWRRDKWGPAQKAAFFSAAAIAARKIPWLIADSVALRDYYEVRFGARPRFIPYGADIETPDEFERLGALNLARNRYGLVVARLVPENNIEMILDSWMAAPREYPLVIVGDAAYDSGYRQKLQRRSTGAPSEVRWLGHVEDQGVLRELWAGARVYLHGHSVGGTNPSLVQALGCGARVLAFDTPFNREVLGGVGATFRSTQDLSDKLTTVLADPETIPGGRDAQAVVRERYSWQSVLGAYEEVLVNAARARSPGAE